MTAKFLSGAARFFYLFWLRKYLYDARGFDTKLGEAGVLNRDVLTVNGQPIWKNVSNAPCWNCEVIRPFTEPSKASAGVAVLRGNLAPDDAVIKPSAAVGIRA